MAVEIYLEPELQTMVQNKQATDEWKQLCEELGMEGQKKLVERSPEASPNPYTPMNESMAVMFAALCPVAVNFRKYGKSTIPIEVLGHIALCEKEKYFDSIKIWYDDVQKDPVVVGYVKTDTYSFDKFLIARFGDEVLPFETLMENAKARIQKAIQTLLEANPINVMVENVFKNGSIKLEDSILKWDHNQG